MTGHGKPQRPGADAETVADWLDEQAPEQSEPDHELDDPRPRNVEAERAVLGSMMLDADTVAVVTPLVTAASFYRPVHGVVFRAIVGLYEDGEPTDVLAVAAKLDRDGDLARVGGHHALVSMTSEVFSTVNVGYWADLVKDAYERARIFDLPTRIAQLAREVTETAELQELVRTATEEATATREASESGVWVGEVIDQHVADWEREDREPGLEWPYTDVQDLTHGAKSGQLIAIAGRPGVGKSTVAMDWGRHAARNNKTVMFISLEMSRDELLMRLACAESGVRFSEVSKGPDAELSAADRMRLRGAQEDIRKMPLRIEDQYDMTLGQIRAAARKTARGPRGLDLLIVDHIGLVTAADARVNRQEQVAGFSRGLKNLAKELAIPVVEVVQLNRGPEARVDKKPQLADLRESGSLEQDADVVVLTYRPDAFERDNPRAGEADLIVAKHRGGPTATITVAHQLHYCRFVDLARGSGYGAREDIA